MKDRCVPSCPGIIWIVQGDVAGKQACCKIASRGRSIPILHVHCDVVLCGRSAATRCQQVAATRCEHPILPWKTLQESRLVARLPAVDAAYSFCMCALCRCLVWQVGCHALPASGNRPLRKPRGRRSEATRRSRKSAVSQCIAVGTVNRGHANSHTYSCKSLNRESWSGRLQCCHRSTFEAGCFVPVRVPPPC